MRFPTRGPTKRKRNWPSSSASGCCACAPELQHKTISSAKQAFPLRSSATRTSIRKEYGNQWCRRGESNPRPRDYETLALPLSYAGIAQFFMLRIHIRMCQGVVSTRTRKASSGARSPSWITFDLLFRANSAWSPTIDGRLLESWSPTSPIKLSTTVPLTGKVPKPTLLGIEHCPTYRIGESLSKRWDGKLCI